MSVKLAHPVICLSCLFVSVMLGDVWQIQTQWITHAKPKWQFNHIRRKRSSNLMWVFVVLTFTHVLHILGSSFYLLHTHTHPHPHIYIIFWGSATEDLAKFRYRTERKVLRKLIIFLYLATLLEPVVEIWQLKFYSSASGTILGPFFSTTVVCICGNHIFQV